MLLSAIDIALKQGSRCCDFLVFLILVICSLILRETEIDREKRDIYGTNDQEEERKRGDAFLYALGLNYTISKEILMEERERERERKERMAEIIILMKKEKRRKRD